MIRFYGKKNLGVFTAFTMACLLTCLFVIYKSNIYVDADNSNLSDYKQIVYDQDSGLGTSEINCIYQEQSGYIWIGTDGGLYRFNGSDFKLYSLWDTDKQDVYCINDLFQDSMGRFWIATNNYGLFYLSDGTIKHFDRDYYDGIKSINDVCEGPNGEIYIATAYGLYSADVEGLSLIRNEQIGKQNISAITVSGEKVWGIYGGYNIFSVDASGNVISQKSNDYTKEELSTISSDDSGNIYIGTFGYDVIKMQDFDGFSILSAKYEGINTILAKGNRVYVCTDGGVGYFKNDNSFSSLKKLSIDNYIKDMIIDYEGNYWFASKRSGILYMAKGKFVNLNRKFGIPENMTNTVCVTNDGETYIGTDEGLYVLDKNNKVKRSDDDPIIKKFDNTSIRDIICDSSGNMWFATYGRNGLIKVNKNKNVELINRSADRISNRVNCVLELNNGDIAVGTEDGISIISNALKVKKSYNYEDGVESLNISCLYQDDDGVLYAGSEGGGLYCIKNGEVKSYTEQDGLNSNFVTAIAKGENGLWIGTNNGLSYFDDTVRSISNIDFSNSIYSLFLKEDRLYIIGSKGYISATEKELLGTKPLTERYYSTGDGIEAPITFKSKNFFDGKVCYICTNKGVSTLDTEEIYTNDVSPRVTVSEIEVEVDGESTDVHLINNTLQIPAKAKKVEISFAVLTFSNRENLKVRYQLKGYDTEPEYLTGNDILQAVYPELKGGEYEFVVSASNGDGIESEQSFSFKIIKEEGILELKVVRYSLVILVALVILLTMFIALRLQRKVAGKSRELEDLAKAHENIVKSSSAKTDYLANMSNEIKLPINAMISSANNILKEGSADENTEKDLREIINSGQNVLGKVDETILLARLESGAEAVVSEPYSITTLICDLSDKMLNSLSEQPIKFLVDLGENIPDILIGDFDKIKTVLNIILDNAMKFTKEGSITLSVDCYKFSDEEDDNVSLVFSISDTGIGITEERLEHIFEIYYVDEAKKVVDMTGNGISLSIAKKITDILGGEIAVESTAGAGTTFTVSISQEMPDVNGKPIPLNENTIDRISREEAEKMWAPDLHVLLVDDVEISRNVALDVISAMEIKCDTASSGLSAIDMVMNNDYDLVFMDIAMPVMNGIDSLKEIRDLSGKKYKTLPVVAMSEDVIGKNREDIISEGFADVVLKPFDITVLAGILQKHVDPLKIKFRSNDVTQYISESRYSEGLKKLEDFFDVAGVLERIGGSIDVYNRILTTFYNQNKNANAELRARFNNDYRGFRNKIHNIRNGCQNIGAVEAAEITLRIENAINLGNKSYVRENMNLVFDCVKVINEYIEEYLAFIEKAKGVTDEEYAAKHKNSSATSIPGDLGLPVEEEEPAFKESEELKDIGNLDDSPELGDEDVSEEPILEEEPEEEFDDQSQIININKLRVMREATYVEDLNLIKSMYQEISDGLYGSEDIEFLKVLGESIEKKDLVEINDLLGTYISLKSSL